MELKKYFRNDNTALSFRDVDKKEWEKIGFTFENIPLFSFESIGTIPKGWTIRYPQQIVSYVESAVFIDEKGFSRARFDVEHRNSGKDVLKYKVFKRFDVCYHDVGEYFVIYFGEWNKPLFIAGYAKFDDKKKLEELEAKAIEFGEKNYPDNNDVNAYWDNEPRDFLELSELINEIKKNEKKEKIKKFREAQTVAKGYEALERGLSGEDHVIEHMEKEGQLEAIKYTMLAKDMRPSREEWEKLGFVFTELDSDDVLCKAEFPEGWVIIPTDHSMWSDIYDDKNRLRGSMFYKAAFYDRSAHMDLKTRFSVQERSFGPNDENAEIYFGNEDEVLFVAGQVEGLYNYQLDDETRKQKREEKERLVALAIQYAKENYPDYRNTNAYWDLEPNRGL